MSEKVKEEVQEEIMVSIPAKVLNHVLLKISKEPWEWADPLISIIKQNSKVIGELKPTEENEESINPSN